MTHAQKAIAAFVVLLLIATTLVVYASHRWAVASCEARSESRQNIKGAFEDLIDVLDPTRASPKTQQFELKLDDRIQPLGCS